MRAAVLEAPNQPLVIRDVRLAEPKPQEVVVRTAAVGLCHSDLHFMEGQRDIPYPAIVGHEVAGIVEKVGSQVTGLKEGDHVVAALTAYCGHCPSCVSGFQVHCEDTSVKMPFGVADRIFGAQGKINQIMNLSGFAEKILVHHTSLVPIRKEIPLDRAALLGCAVTTGTGAVWRTANVEPGSSVAVIGCGGIGLATINGAAIAGAARIIAVDVSKKKLEMARAFGATDFVNASECDPVEAVRDLTGGGVDNAFECIGLPLTARQTIEMTKPHSTATIIGVFPRGAEISFAGELLLSQRKVQGSFFGSALMPIDIPRLVDHYLAGRLKIDELISQRISLDQINEGFAELKAGNVARSVVVFPDAMP